MVHRDTMDLASYRFGEFCSLKKVWAYYVLAFVSFGFLLSVTQTFGESPDYSQYDDFINLVRSIGGDVFTGSRFEPGFSALVLILTTVFSSNVVVYSCIVAAVLFIKGTAILHCSVKFNIFFVVAFFYLVRYFPLHELTQLRAACGFAFLLVASILFFENKIIFGLLATAVALLFHMSSAVVIPGFFLVTTKRVNVIFIGIAIYFVAALATNVVADYFASYITVLAAYKEAGFGDWAPHPFSVPLLLDWALIIYAFIMWDKLTVLMKRVLLLQVIGMGVFYGVIDFPAFASRMREAYSIFWVFFIADSLRFNRIRMPVFGFVFASTFVYCYVYFIKGDFFT